jgi:transposase
MINNVVGLDISKNVFHLYSQTEDGKVVKKKLKRGELLAYIANMPVSLIGMEACGGAHDWAREFTTSDLDDCGAGDTRRQRHRENQSNRDFLHIAFLPSDGVNLPCCS